MVVQGMGGLMSVTGHPESEPTRLVLQLEILQLDCLQLWNKRSTLR